MHQTSRAAPSLAAVAERGADLVAEVGEDALVVASMVERKETKGICHSFVE